MVEEILPLFCSIMRLQKNYQLLYFGFILPGIQSWTSRINQNPREENDAGRRVQGFASAKLLPLQLT